MVAKKKGPPKKRAMRTVSVVLTYKIKIAEVDVPVGAEDYEAAHIAEEFIDSSEWNLVDWQVSE